MMKPAVKNAVESALVALAVAACSFWFLLTAAALDEPPEARIALLAITLACSMVAHWTFMAVVLRRSGRALLPWMIGIVLFSPVGTVALLALLVSEDGQQRANG